LKGEKVLAAYKRKKSEGQQSDKRNTGRARRGIVSRMRQRARGSVKSRRGQQSWLSHLEERKEPLKEADNHTACGGCDARSI